MSKFRSHIIVVGLCSLVLSACQSTHFALDRLLIKQVEKRSNTDNNVKLYCSDNKSCEFSRVDQIEIVNDQSKRVNPEAIRKGYVHLTGDAKNQSDLFLTIPAQQHEVIVRFYPISNKHAEVFHLIHQFKANKTYQLTMYRQQAKKSGSLLSVSAPTPLCVDVREEQKLVRRFCRPHDAVTGISEFVEEKI